MKYINSQAENKHDFRMGFGLVSPGGSSVGSLSKLKIQYESSTDTTSQKARTGQSLLQALNSEEVISKLR